jgi:hypothetical protein
MSARDRDYPPGSPERLAIVSNACEVSYLYSQTVDRLMREQRLQQLSELALENAVARHDAEAEQTLDQ